MFEIIKSDLAARVAKIYTNHGQVSTPAYVPVIHPVKQSIPSAEIKEMGFDLVITNAYITRKNYTPNTKQSIHDIINYDGSVMTDSGGYQVLEYGDLDVTPQDMAKFEQQIMTDFAIPLDKPTGFGMTKTAATRYVNHTLKVSRDTIKSSKDNGQIWIGPIQGGEHSDLVARSTRGLIKAGFQMLALGSPVEFMESYEYRLLAQMIIAAKSQMPESVPLHLFGAGHPLTIPFAVALGCDTFDSASYILYAKQDRYITNDGTRNLDDITVFPCNCKICTSFTPDEIKQADNKIDLVARHNLYAIKLEVDRVRQAILEGRLWEYVIQKTRAHPRLYEIIDVITDQKFDNTPRFKNRAIFLYDDIDQFRPEVRRFHEMVRRFKTKKQRLIITPIHNTKPGYLSSTYKRLKRLRDFESYQICQYSPHLGIIPIELSDIFPAAHHEAARIVYDPTKFVMFAETWKIFFTNNSFTAIHYDKNDKFLSYYTKHLHITKRDLKEKRVYKD